MTVFNDPTFDGIDFGFDNTDSDDFLAVVNSIYPGARPARFQRVGFPGVNGAFIAELGLGSRGVTWDLFVLFKLPADQETFEAALRDKLNNRAWAMTFHGKSFEQVRLIGMKAYGGATPCLQTWLYGQRYLLAFEVLDDE